MSNVQLDVLGAAVQSCVLGSSKRMGRRMNDVSRLPKYWWNEKERQEEMSVHPWVY